MYALLQPKLPVVGQDVLESVGSLVAYNSRDTPVVRATDRPEL